MPLEETREIHTWMSLFKAKSNQELRKIMEKSPKFESVAKQLIALNADEEIREQVRLMEEVRATQLTLKEEAREQGREEGREQGREEGINIGIEQEKITIAKKSIEMGLNIEHITLITGLDINIIKDLQK